MGPATGLTTGRRSAIQIKPHVLACRSLLLGTCNILVLPVPAGWRVGDSAFPPEVDAWTLRGEVNWATAGRGAWRVAVVAPGRPDVLAMLDARVRVEPARGARAGAAPDPTRELSRVLAAGDAEMGGHPARWALGQVRGGLIRSPRPALAVGLGCPQTGRHVHLLVAGGEPVQLQELLGALSAGLVCH